MGPKEVKIYNQSILIAGAIILIPMVCFLAGFLLGLYIVQ